MASDLIGVCGPFTDVVADAFCPFVLEIFYLGITTGTTPTTYDPTANVTRLQMAAFLSRTVDGVLKRGSRRAALARFWTEKNGTVLGVTTVGSDPQFPACDGADVWIPNFAGGSVSRARASDGRLLETWTGAANAQVALAAMGKILVTGFTVTSGNLYGIDPAQPAGAVTTLATNLGKSPLGLTFDGARIWMTDDSLPGSVSIVTPGASIPWTVTTITSGFSQTHGAVFDGANVWVTDTALKKLDSAGAILQTVTLGSGPYLPVFDGINLWVPNHGSNTLSVVRAASGAVLATLTGNGLSFAWQASFDGERVLVPNFVDAGTVSLWKAADLTALGSFSTGASSFPLGSCSDGLNFWVTFRGNQLARF